VKWNGVERSRAEWSGDATNLTADVKARRLAASRVACWAALLADYLADGRAVPWALWRAGRRAWKLAGASVASTVGCSAARKGARTAAAMAESRDG
jgi:hypothetical protein